MKFKYRFLPFYVTAALGAMSGNLIAAPIHSATAQWTVGGDSTGSPHTDGPQSGPNTYVDILGDRSNNGSNIFYHSYGAVLADGSVYFGSRASGTGVYDLTSQYNLSGYSFSVPGSGSVPVYFSFTIDNGELGVYCGTTCGGTGLAQINIDIRVDASADPDTSFQGEGRLAIQNNTTTLTHSGLLSALFSNSSPTATSGSIGYGWNATPINLFLGNYTGGSTLLIDYDLITRAQGDFSQLEADSYAGFGCYEGGFAGLGENGGVFLGSNCYSGNTIARIGDPFGQDPGRLTTAAAPEPGAIALLGVGLAGAIATRRRRKKRES